jgi:hypothetical protein
MHKNGSIWIDTVSNKIVDIASVENGLLPVSASSVDILIAKQGQNKNGILATAQK